MSITSLPGQNTTAINAQSPPQLSMAGPQAGVGMINPYKSSYAGMPSNYAAPSTMQTQNTWYDQAAQQAQQPQVAQMIKALRGRA
jgi:hypothetical protein